MTRLLLSLSLGIALFTGAYLLGRSASQHTGGPLHPAPSISFTTRESSRRAQETSRDELHQALVQIAKPSAGAPSLGTKTGETLQKIARRLQEPYPARDATQAHRDPHDHEVTYRLSLLRALGRAVPSLPRAQTQPARAIYEAVLKNPDESWLVKRLALSGVQPLWKTFSEKQKDQVIIHVDARALATWNISDRDLAATILGSHAP